MALLSYTGNFDALIQDVGSVFTYTCSSFNETEDKTVKLRSKFLWFTLPMILIPLLLVSTLSYLYTKGMSYRLSTVQLESSLLQLASDTSARFHAAASNTATFPNNIYFEKYLLGENSVGNAEQEAQIVEKLEELRKAFPSYAEVALYNSDGAIAVSVSDVFDRQDYQASFIKQMVEARLDHHEGVWVPEDEKRMYYLVAKAIKRKYSDDQFVKNRVETIGFLFISVDMGFLNELMIEGVQKQGIEYFLSDKNGTILFAPKDDMDNEISDSSNVVSERLRQIISSRTSSIQRYDTLSTPFYGGYKRLTQGLFLVGTITESDLFKASNTLKQYTFVFFIVVILLSVILVMGLVNSVLANPIKLLRKSIARFKNGEYDQEIIISGSDELSLLAEDFKELSQGLAESSETVRNLAYYDGLTGLPNRITFNVNLKKAINHCERRNSVLGLLFIDLDNFKYANDVYGHQVGDELLKETAVRLESCLRSIDIVSRQLESGSEWVNDLVVRLGGDEFTVILADIEQAHQASMVAQRIVDVLSHPFEFSGSVVNIGASIGIAMYPVDGTTADSLIKSADLAMYEAKQRGRNNYQFFTKALNQAVAKRLEMEASLRQAIAQESFFLLYQPKVRMNDGEVVGVEALLRWRHPEMGVLAPSQFMRVAEDTGLVVDIERLVLQLACCQLRRWHEEGMGHLKISIDLSSQQLLHTNTVDDIQRALVSHNVSPENLELEFPESVLIADEKVSFEVLGRLKELGIKITIDDFGSGYASLNYIRTLPIDLIKLDRGFVDGIEENEGNQAIISAILSMAKALSLKVVAEGVETIAQLGIINKLSCEYVQGNYFSEPVEVEKLKFCYVIPSLGGYHILSQGS